MIVGPIAAINTIGMEEQIERAFPGCKHTSDSAFSAIFSSMTSLVLIVHLIIMVSISVQSVLY